MSLAQYPGLNGGRFGPVLFLRVPRAAGTSLELALRNAFGDNHVRKIDYVDGHTQQTIDELVRDELENISCLSGHLPIYLFDTSLERFRPFTVLRDPVARILSLYRAIRKAGVQEQERLGLPAEFSLGDFLRSRHSALYGEINNGMVRMLCGDVTLTDPDFPEFWEIANAPRALASALANLQQMDFGLSEEMGRTLALMQVRLSVPYPLLELRENATKVGAEGNDINDLHQIVACNTMDLALYGRAKAIFRDRVGAMRGAAMTVGMDPSSVFHPPMNLDVPVGNIAGRQGFHGFEENGLAWLREEHPAELRFISPTEDLIRLRLHVYCITDFYPLHEVVVTVNERPVQVAATPAGDRWFDVETEHFDTLAGLNRMTIRAPQFTPVQDLTPGTSDERSLGIAVGRLSLGP